MTLNPTISTALIALTVISGFVATAFIWWLYRKDPARPRSWLLWTLATTSTATEVAGAYLGWIAYIRVTEGLTGVPVWTSALTTLATLTICSIPTWLVVQFIRHSDVLPTPPKRL